MIKTHKGAKARKMKRVRSNIKGTADRPRLSVFRSNKHIYIQAIDDVNGIAIGSESSHSVDAISAKAEIASTVGEKFGEKIKKLNIKTAIFDKGWYKYHGRVKNLADGIRKTGIKF